MAKQKKELQDDPTNYKFLLECMAALTATALFIAAIALIATYNTGAASLAAASLITASSVFALASLPLVIGVIALVCGLAYLLKGNDNPGDTAIIVRNGTTTSLYPPVILPPSTYCVSARPRVQAPIHTHGGSIFTNHRPPQGPIHKHSDTKHVHFISDLSG